MKKLFKYIINSSLKIFNLQLNKITHSNHFYYHIVKTLDFYNIILGGNKVLSGVTGLMVESSISKLYKNEETFLGIINLIKKLGFSIWSIERGFTNKKSGQVFQLDIIFTKKNEK